MKRRSNRVTVAQIEHVLGAPITKRGQERHYHCPKCGERSDPKLGVNVAKQVYSCFICGAGRGKHLRDLFEDFGLERPDPASLEPDDPEDAVPEKIKRPKRVPDEELACFQPFPVGLFDLNANRDAAQALAYLKDVRGLDAKVIRRARLAYGSGKWSGYVLFPTYDGDKLKFWSGRAWDPSRFPPHLHAADGTFPYSRAETLYGMDRAPILSWSVLCEAPLGALKCNVFAMASYGKTVSPAQEERLRSLKLRKLVIYFDREPKAQQDAWELALRLEGACREGVFVAIPPREDPAACSYEENAKAVAEAVLATPAEYHRLRLSGNWLRQELLPTDERL